MKTRHDDHQLDDEFEPIELGSVSDETKGEGGNFQELDPDLSQQTP